MRRLLLSLLTVLFVSHSLTVASGQEEKAKAKAKPVRGSLVEDRAARKLIEAGEARYEADEKAKAVEIWQSVIERYPRSRVRFIALMRLGVHFLDRERAFDRARASFEAVASEENRDEQQRAEAKLKIGVCYYHTRNYGKSFRVLREVIEEFPISPQVNQAYYYIGLGHFKLAHYSRAIESLQKVGTTLDSADSQVEKLEAGKRLFVKIEDADLAVLEPGQPLEVECLSSSGDKEKVACYPVGRNVRVVLGSIASHLGLPKPGNGLLEVAGNDKITIQYTDQHTAEKELDRQVIREVTVVGNAVVQITDGAFGETLRGVVLDKGVNVQITDADRDLSRDADKLTAVVEVHRLKSDEELRAEEAAAAAKRDAEKTEGAEDPEDEAEIKIEPYKLVDSAQVSLAETIVTSRYAVQSTAPGDAAGEVSLDNQPGGGEADKAAAKKEPNDGPPATHSGVFRAVVSLEKTEQIKQGDAVLQALPGDMLRILYLDEKHRGEGARQVKAEARCLEGNIGGVRVTRAVISDQELRIKTKLKTSDALTNIGNRYKEFGLKDNAKRKYEQALEVCEEVMSDARKLGGQVLEQTYVQLWHIYFEMDRLPLAAAMCERLQREFPSSGFVDDALLQLADVARKQNDLNRAIGIYSRLVNMKTSQLRGDAQFGIAACYEQMATAAEGPGAAQLFDRSFQEYKKVYDQFPDSGRVGEAVAKMANYYYQQKEYARAVDTFESVLSNHPDAKFLDVILFNYARCLYRMERKAEARRKFDQLIGDFPESPLASSAKKISDALSKEGS